MIGTDATLTPGVSAAIGRDDVANFVDNLFLVYIILIIASIAISWVISLRGSLPYNRPVRAVAGFIDETTAPYLNAFRRILPPVGAGGMALDLSPMIGLILLFLAQAIVVGLIRGVKGHGPGFGRAAAVALVALALDQLTKAIIRGQVAPGETIDVVAGIEIVHVANRGIAFGLLDDAGSWVLVLAALAFASLLAMFLAYSDRRGLWFPIGLLAGGAIGNLIDRIREGAVTDFIDLGAWPAFNVADIEITFGVIILVWMFAFGSEPEPEGELEPNESSSPEPESR